MTTINATKNIKCSVYLSPDVVARIDRAIEGREKKYWRSSKSRSAVIERALRAHYKMPKRTNESHYTNSRRRVTPNTGTL